MIPKRNMAPLVLYPVLRSLNEFKLLEPGASVFHDAEVKIIFLLFIGLPAEASPDLGKDTLPEIVSVFTSSSPTTACTGATPDSRIPVMMSRYTIKTMGLAFIR